MSAPTLTGDRALNALVSLIAAANSIENPHARVIVTRASEAALAVLAGDASVTDVEWATVKTYVPERHWPIVTLTWTTDADSPFAGGTEVIQIPGTADFLS